MWIMFGVWCSWDNLTKLFQIQYILHPSSRFGLFWIGHSGLKPLEIWFLNPSWDGVLLAFVSSEPLYFVLLGIPSTMPDTLHIATLANLEVLSQNPMCPAACLPPSDMSIVTCTSYLFPWDILDYQSKTPIPNIFCVYWHCVQRKPRKGWGESIDTIFFFQCNLRL